MKRPVPMLLLLVLAGCTPALTIDEDYDPATDFSKYKTWSWLGSKPSEKDIDSLTQQRIQSAIEGELPHHGLKKVAEGADLNVVFQISVQRKIESSPATVSVGYGWGPAHVGVSKSPTRTYDEGTLILDLVDAKTKTLLWRGTAVGTVDPKASPEERQGRINEAVGYLLEGYPPGKR